MTEELKNKLLDMLQDISYGFDSYQDGSDEEGNEFWGAWSSMQDYISKLSTIEEVEE